MGFEQGCMSLWWPQVGRVWCSHRAHLGDALEWIIPCTGSNTMYIRVIIPFTTGTFMEGGGRFPLRPTRMTQISTNIFSLFLYFLWLRSLAAFNNERSLCVFLHRDDKKIVNLLYILLMQRLAKSRRLRRVLASQSLI